MKQLNEKTRQFNDSKEKTRKKAKYNQISDKKKNSARSDTSITQKMPFQMTTSRLIHHNVRSIW